ncbi:MAG: hypothetical protein IT464_15510 [Planctomycetes bacterium]|nr:hypothetical protein [Planctomycetota bacterium]
MDPAIDTIISDLLKDLDAASLDDSVEAARAPQLLAKRESDAARAAYDAGKAPPAFRVSDKVVLSAIGREWMFRDLRLHIKLLTRQVTNTLLGDKSPHKDDVLLKLMGEVNYLHRIMEIRNAIADFAQPERMRLRQTVLKSSPKPPATAMQRPQSPRGANAFGDLRRQQEMMSESLKQWQPVPPAPETAAEPSAATQPAYIDNATAAAYEAEHDAWLRDFKHWGESGRKGPAPKFPLRVLESMRFTAKHEPRTAMVVRDLEERLKRYDAMPQSPEVSAPGASG